MPSTSFVRARIEEELKTEATAVLSELGLSVSDAIRMLLTRVAKDGAFPLELKVPNPETRAAMEEARAAMKARSDRFAWPEDLFGALAEEAARR